MGNRVEASVAAAETREMREGEWPMGPMGLMGPMGHTCPGQGRWPS